MKLSKTTQIMLDDVMQILQTIGWAALHLSCWFSVVVTLAGLFIYTLVLGWGSANGTWLFCLIVALAYTTYFWRKSVKIRLRNWK